MSKFIALISILTLSLFSSIVYPRPYPIATGMAASADSASTAGTNPAGITRFDSRSVRVDLIVVSSESTWENRIDDGAKISSDDSSTIVVPMVYFAQPINDSLSFGFTFLGASFSDDLGDWPGKYFIESYDSLYVSAFPSLAYRVNDKLSVAASLAITYSRFEQERAVANILDPGYGDGKSELETDGFDLGFGLSMLYQINDRTRWGLTYQSEIDPELEGDAKYSGLGPNTSELFDRLGLTGADVTVKSKSPQSVVAGLYHEFDNNHAMTVDLAWVDFSNFQLSEFYFDGNSLASNEASYQDIFALSASYTWPVADRWMLGVGGLYVDDMIKDDDRTMTLRLDSIWSVGIAAEWKWTSSRTVMASLSYMEIGDAPVTTPEVPGFGSLTGKYSNREAFLFQISISTTGL